MGRKLPKPVGWHYEIKEAVLDDEGKPTCRWCFGKITAKRRSSFCSKECRDEWERRLDWKLTRQLVFNLQKGICKRCGIDLRMIDPQFCTTQLQYAMKIEAGDERWKKWSPPVSLVDGKPLARDWWRRQREIAEEWARDNKCLGRSVWEVDHCPALALGGDWFDLTGLQALCKSCHTKKTREDAALIAVMRNAPKRS